MSSSGDEAFGILFLLVWAVTVVVGLFRMLGGGPGRDGGDGAAHGGWGGDGDGGDGGGGGD